MSSSSPQVFARSRGARIRHRGSVGMGFAALVLLAFESVLLSQVVADVFLQGATLAVMTPLLITLVVLLVARGLLLWLQEVLAQTAAGQVKRSLRAGLLDRLAALGPDYTGGERTGELVNTIGAGVETLDAYITQFLPARTLAVLGPVFVFLTILVLDPWTTIVLLVTGPFMVLLLALIGGRARELTERRFGELGWMSAFFLDVLQGIATLKLFGRSREQAINIEEISRHYGKTTMEVLATAFQTSLVMEWAATAATAFVALEVSFRLMNGMLPFDRALAVLLLTPEFFMPLRQMAIRYHAGATGKAAATRIFAILDTPASPVAHPPAAAPQPAAALPASQPPAIHFAAVTHAYAGGERPALDDVTLDLPAGRITALLGPTGAGKSTIVALLLRFFEPGAGVITVDGAPLSSFDAAAWRTRVAWAPQHPHLFDASVAANIRLARPDADDAAVVAAARAANAHEFISALPAGYATQLGERGSRLSGGQRQRIAIARAFLKDAPLLLLDEPTAHLDPENAAAIRAALDRLMAGRTVLLVTHELEMASIAHQVITLRQGSVATGQEALP